MSKKLELTISEHALNDHDIIISYKECGGAEDGTWQDGHVLARLKFERQPFYDITDFDGLVNDIAEVFVKKITDHRDSLLEKPEEEIGRFANWRAERATKNILKKLGIKNPWKKVGN